MFTNSIRRTAGFLTAALATLTGLIALAPAAFASVPAPGPGPGPVFSGTTSGTLPAVTHAATAGMLGWQIALIAVGAALLATLVTTYVSHIQINRLRQVTS